jgi:hypothetical protein
MTNHNTQSESIPIPIPTPTPMGTRSIRIANNWLQAMAKPNDEKMSKPQLLLCNTGNALPVPPISRRGASRTPPNLNAAPINANKQINCIWS